MAPDRGDLIGTGRAPQWLEFAQQPDLNLEIVLRNHHTGPAAIDHFLLEQRDAAMVDQCQQRVEGSGTELGRLAVDHQPACHALERAVSEPVVARCGVQGRKGRRGGV
jgi:hypothetical protein